MLDDKYVVYLRSSHQLGNYLFLYILNDRIFNWTIHIEKAMMFGSADEAFAAMEKLSKLAENFKMGRVRDIIVDRVMTT